MYAIGPVMTISEQGGYVPRCASAPPMMKATAKAVPIEPGTEKLDIEFTNQFHLAGVVVQIGTDDPSPEGRPPELQAPATSAGASLSPPAANRNEGPNRFDQPEGPRSL